MSGSQVTVGWDPGGPRVSTVGGCAPLHCIQHEGRTRHCKQKLLVEKGIDE